MTSFLPDPRCHALSEDGYLSVLSSAPNTGTVGGRTYDAVIMACAVDAGVDALLTFNDRDFLPLVRDDVEIVVPKPPA